MSLYSTSTALINRIEKISQNVRSIFQDSVMLIEYITLPEAGQHIILRFEVRKEDLNLDDLDRLENEICTYVGDEFWCVLAGDIFAKVQPSFRVSELPLRLGKLAQLLKNEPVPMSHSSHSLPLKNDARLIRSILGLQKSEWVWEVEIPFGKEASPLIRVISERAQKGPVWIGDQSFEIEALRPDDSYLTLVKAYPRARLEHKALLHYVFEHTR